MAEAGAIVLLAGAAYVMSMKDKLSLRKKQSGRPTKKIRIKLRQASPGEKENEGETKVSKGFSQISKDPQYRRN